jgi:CRISPR system Cascade subunit CasA
MSARFDLLEEPWIPCRRERGGIVLLGIRDTLARAPYLTGIEDPSPLVTAAILRLLVAVLHSIYRGPADNIDRAIIWDAERFDLPRLDAYFTKWSARFDLFSADHPFLQGPGTDAATAEPLVRWVPEFNLFSGPRLFDHTSSEPPPAVLPAQAARWLVSYYLYARPEGRGWRRGPALHLNAFLAGGTLFDTLVLNLVPYDWQSLDAKAQDAPRWEADDWPAPVERFPAGPLDYLTWPIRRLLLLPEEDTTDGTVVRRVAREVGPFLPSDTPIRDPYVAMTRGEDQRIVDIQRGRALWRDADALFAFAGDPAVPNAGEVPRSLCFQAADEFLDLCEQPRVPWLCQTFGLALENTSNVVLWRHDQLPVPAAVLHGENAPALVDALTTAVQKAEKIHNALLSAIRRVAQLVLNADQPDKVRAKDYVPLAGGWGLTWKPTNRDPFLTGVPFYWSCLDEPFRVLLTRLPADSEAAQTAWRHELETAADHAYERACQAAGNSGRALRASIRAREETVTKHWSPKEKTKTGG